jgi:hypothetical protein
MSRSLLARPWYRNAIEGGTPAFDSPAVTIDETWRGAVILNVPARGRYLANIREQNATAMCIRAAVDDGLETAERCAPGQYGLHWISLPLKLAAGRNRIVFQIRSADESLEKSRLTMFLDGITLTNAHSHELARSPRPAIVVYSTEWAFPDGMRGRLWFPAGRYRFGWYGTDGALVDDRAKFDGKMMHHTILFPSPGYHVLADRPAAAEFLMLYDAGTERFTGTTAIGRKRSSTTWDVDLASPAVLRATVLNDRSWTLEGSSARFAGFDCDLVDTCFGRVPAGRYVLRHRWPTAIVVGLAATSLTWFATIALCVFQVFVNRTRNRIA